MVTWRILLRTWTNPGEVLGSGLDVVATFERQQLRTGWLGAGGVCQLMPLLRPPQHTPRSAVAVLLVHWSQHATLPSNVMSFNSGSFQHKVGWCAAVDVRFGSVVVQHGSQLCCRRSCVCPFAAACMVW
jgi:hypothetical protein